MSNPFQNILTIQQALAAAATAAVINSLLNPQQAAALATATALADSTSNDLQLQQQQQQQQQENRHSPVADSSPNAQGLDLNSARIQDILLQLQQQATVCQSPLALNLNPLNSQPLLGATNLSGSPVSRQSPISNRLAPAQELQAAVASATGSNTHQSNQQASPVKKLKRHHNNQPQQAFQNRSLEATSKPQRSSPKNHSTISNLSNRNSNTSNNTSSSSSSAFISNNVGLPRKLVRGQDVWLGRGAEQTRQILKCMWCSQSFRTLAEMTQHMKITQHYTNIISQEQITSWRQPENSEASSKHGKHSSQARNLDISHDDSSDKFNDSDREDNFSNDDDLEPRKHRLSNAQSRIATDQNKNDLVDNNSTTGSNQGDSAATTPLKGLSSSKPLTRSRRREHESLPTKRDHVGRSNSPATSSSSQQRQSSGSSVSSGSMNSGNLILGDLNEDSETNKDQQQQCKTNGNSDEQTSDETPATDDKLTDSDQQPEKSSQERDVDGRDGDDVNDEDDDDDSLRRDENRKPSEDPSTGNERLKEMTNDEGSVVGNDKNDIVDDDEEGDNDDEHASETNESTATNTTSGAKSGSAGQKGETGDPLSALETMVEKSFDPRLRPGVANGGILQRLGIDEEVCPPWQHINYANWYAAAAYGHPMAAALLAAGINLQNGIKLSKNVDSKKNEE